MTQFISPTKAQLSSVARRIDFKNDQNKPKFLQFSPFFRVYDPKAPTKSNHTRINSFSGKTCIGRYIPSYLATITNVVLVSPVTSESDQWYERVQDTLLDPTAPARPLQSGYSHVHGRLKTSKMAEIDTSTPPPPALKQIFGNSNHVRVFGGSLWTFSQYEIQINRTFFLI